MTPANSAKHGPAQNRCRAGIGAVIQPHGFARRIKPRDRVPLHVQHTGLRVTAQTAECEAIALL